MFDSLREQLVEITTGAVEKILREKLDAKSDQRLVTAVLDELEQDAKT